MQAVLVMFRSDGERRSFSITRDVTVVGRREDADLRIPLGDVSRKHCRLVKEDETLRLEDLGSSNGTYHNGQRVEREAILSAGDSVQVGPVVFVLQVDGYPADDQLQPITVDTATASSYSGDVPPMPAPPEEQGLEELQPLEDEAVTQTFPEALPEAEALSDADALTDADALPGEELEPLPEEPAPLDEHAPAAAEAEERFPMDDLEPLPEPQDDGFQVVDGAGQEQMEELEPLDELDHIEMESDERQQQ